MPPAFNAYIRRFLHPAKINIIEINAVKVFSFCRLTAVNAQVGETNAGVEVASGVAAVMCVLLLFNVLAINLDYTASSVRDVQTGWLLSPSELGSCIVLKHCPRLATSGECAGDAPLLT